MSNLTIDKARQKVSMSVIVVVLSLAIAAISGVLLGPLDFGSGPNLVWNLIVAEAIFGLGLIYASMMLRQGSTFISEKTQKPLRAVRGAGTSVWSFFVFFVVFNLGMSFSLGTAVSIVANIVDGSADVLTPSVQLILANALLVAVIYLVVLQRSETAGLRADSAKKLKNKATE